MELNFEWDPEKAATNLTKHKVSFELAARVFSDPKRLERIDDREDYGEDRYFTIGMVEMIVLVVAYTYRGDNIRIISARKAEPRERKDYSDR